MEFPNGSLKECSHLFPQLMKAGLGWVHALAIQTAVAVDAVMLMTFGTQHGRTVADARGTSYATSE
jgi:hypothetical protein